MPRLMSVAFTEDAVRRRAKAGEPLVRITDVQVVSVRREPLEQITAADVAREGFPGMSREEFMRRFFVDAQGIQPSDEVTPIEWVYVSPVVSRPW